MNVLRPRYGNGGAIQDDAKSVLGGYTAVLWPMPREGSKGGERQQPHNEECQMACEHDLADMNTAAHFDGLCPICLKERIDVKDAEVLRLRKGIQDYLDGDFEPRIVGKIDKCPHGRYGYETCKGCIDAHFRSILNP